MSKNNLKNLQAVALAGFFGQGIGVSFPTKPKENWQSQGKRKKPKVR